MSWSRTRSIRRASISLRESWAAGPRSRQPPGGQNRRLSQPAAGASSRRDAPPIPVPERGCWRKAKSRSQPITVRRLLLEEFVPDGLRGKGCEIMARKRSRIMSGTAATSPAQEFERLYILRNDSEVRRFINQHQFLEPLLREVHARVQNYFPGSPLFLEVFTDPEDQGEQELVASVSTGLPSPAAHEK